MLFLQIIKSIAIEKGEIYYSSCLTLKPEVAKVQICMFEDYYTFFSFWSWIDDFSMSDVIGKNWFIAKCFSFLQWNQIDSNFIHNIIFYFLIFVYYFVFDTDHKKVNQSDDVIIT